uniref:Uncharacterized protein n=1 Tax=Tetranychus urticae TaxID=32264 RepID=T1K8E4_TETUR
MALIFLLLTVNFLTFTTWCGLSESHTRLFTLFIFHLVALLLQNSGPSSPLIWLFIFICKPDSQRHQERKGNLLVKRMDSIISCRSVSS